MQNTVETPQRLSLPPRGGDWRQTLWALLGLLMFGGMLVAIAIYTVPNLVSDWRIRDTAVPVAGSRVTEGSCSSRLFLNICDATLSVQTKSGLLSRDVNYIFADVHSGSYNVTVLADPEYPDLLTTDIALKKLWNRIITLLVGGGILLALTVGGMIRLVWRPRRH